MRSILLLFLLGTFQIAESQSDSIEKQLIYNKWILENNDPVTARQELKEWNDAVTKLNGYPEIKLDSNGKFRKQYFDLCPDLDAGFLFERILEYFSINSDKNFYITYSSEKSYKIIARCTFPIYYNNALSYNKKIISTLIVTIKDGKILFELEDIYYQCTTPGHYDGDYWVQEQIQNVDVTSVLPISKQKKSFWNEYIDLLWKTQKTLDNEIALLEKYIAGYNTRYNF